MDEIRQAVFEAAARAEACDAVSAEYASLQNAIDLRRPICKTSGRCCRFEEYGHRMYVTTLELAKFVRDWSVARGPLSVAKSLANSPGRQSLPLLMSSAEKPLTDLKGCPFQIEGLCSVHTIRPFGCRVFFCDETATDWQHDQYEQHHARLRGMHEALGVPYFYIEWRVALNALGLF